ncbi:hypothetical protein AB0I84_18500 [Streptomyces spectabilis]|uniref:hypothetical protein n=1 Tax=Streptomyces spectabilis TaxID=68270 RepID=UPI0033DC4ED8
MSKIDAMPRYFEGAPPWHLRLAREALSAKAWPDVDQMTEGGHAVSVAHGATDNPRSVGVQLTMDTPRKTHMERPKSHGPGARWDALIDRLRADLTAAGMTDVRTTNMGVWARVPQPDWQAVEFVVAEDPDPYKVGVFHVSCRQHPELSARIDGGFHHGVMSGSSGYVACDSSGKPIPGTGFREAGGELKAAAGYGRYCGIPDDLVRVVDLDTVALRIVDTAFEQAEPGRCTALVSATINGNEVAESAKSQRDRAGRPLELADGPTRRTQKHLARLVAYAMNHGGGRMALVSRRSDGGPTITQRWTLTRHGAVQTPLSELPDGARVAPAPHLY